MMIKTGRNRLCPCGSNLKYKKCCLHRGVTTSRLNHKKPQKATIVKTLTDEFFQPMRLYYKMHCKASLGSCLKNLKCIDYTEELDDWTLRYEKEAASIQLKVSPEKIPPEAQPLIIATIYLENNESMIVDVRSIERAAKVIDFFDKHIARDIAEITHAAIYNKLITATHQTAKNLNDIDFDEIFYEGRMTTIDPEKTMSEIESMAAQYEDKLEALNSFIQSANKVLPEIEKFPIYYYEEGIKHFEIMCSLRQMVALQHFLGKRDYTLRDLIQEVIQ